MAYFTGKGYGVSQYLDVTGIPLLTVTNKSTGKVITAFDRVAVQFDPTLKAPHTLDQIDGGRMDLQTSSALKTAVGGKTGQELDHKISLELGGSNQLANLGLDITPQTAGANATDAYENKLAAAVQSGAMSLVNAWEAIAAAKSFVLAEDLTELTNNSWASAAEGIIGGLGALVGISSLGNINANLQAQIKQDADTLAKTPYNLALRNKIFTEQIQLTKEQLNLSTADAAAYTKVYTANIANYSGNNATEVIGALTANEQQIIGISGKEPNVLGIPVGVWSNVAAALTIGQGLIATIGIVAFVIALFTAGPAAVAAAAGGEGVAGLLTAFGSSYTLGTAVTAFFLYEIFGAVATRIPMITKQMMDSGSIVPSLISTSLNDDIKNLKALGAAPKTSSTTATAAAGGAGAPYGAPAGNIIIAPVSSGVVGSAAAFTPRPLDSIESATDLTTAAQNNLSAFFTAFPGVLGYEIVLANSVIADDGSVRFGGKNRVVKGYTTKGKPEYKNVTNKFAVLEVYYVPSPRKRVILDKITLGPVDETTYTPAKEDLAAIISHLQSNFVLAAPGTETMTVAQPVSQILNPLQAPSPSTPTAQATPPTPTPPTPAPNAPQACSATTLYEFFQAQGGTSPSLLARAAQYEQLGLGTAATYVANAEQNTKLLQALQAKLGCFVAQPTSTQAPAAGSSPVAPTPPPALIPSPTSAQLAARLNPTAVVVNLPTEGQIFRAVGDDVGKNVYQVQHGTIQQIAAPTFVANTNMAFPDGTLWAKGQPVPAGKNPRDAHVISPSFTGGDWSTISAGDNYDAQKGAGSWQALPAFNMADIQTVLEHNNGTLPNTATYTLN